MHDPRPAPGPWLPPSDDWLRTLLALPELALVDDSCAAETALHGSLVASPTRTVGPGELQAVADADARANHAMFLGFRDALLAAGTLEAYYLALMRGGRVAIPPVFVDRIVQAIVQHLLDGRGDAFESRAAELLFRPQRITRSEGRLLCADLAAIDLLNQTGGFGELGRLLVQGKAPLAAQHMAVLGPDNAGAYWLRRERHAFVLDLTHELSSDIGHGLTFTLSRAHSGLKALARALERWVAHLLGVRVAITPLHKVADEAWRWHIGLDVESMALLNDLYEDRPVDEDRLQRLVSLFRLDFADPAEMRTDLAGKPVYLGLSMTAEGVLRLKPQNLLLNLPLARAM